MANSLHHIDRIITIRFMRVDDPKTGRSYFSKRRRRFDNEHTPRELTFSCYKGFAFLNSDRTRHWFLEVLESARREWSVDLWAWVIMPEHVHLIVMPHDVGTPIGSFQGAIKEQVARKAIQWLKQNAPEWIPRITVREGARQRRRFWQQELVMTEISTTLEHCNP